MKYLAAWAVIAGVVGTGCIVGGECTLIGCADGVDITWSGASSQDRGTLVADGVTYAFDCAAAPSSTVWCTSTGVRLQRTPTALRVDVVTPSGARSGTFSPRYTTSRPNGPDCDPVCRGATVTVP
ncbi:MAG: hypothetical protein U0325_11250 [Polyangiales bacterium]